MTVIFFTRYGSKIMLIRFCSLINLNADLLNLTFLFTLIV